MPVPLWVMQQQFGAYGARGPERPKDLDKDACYCAGEKCGKLLRTFMERNWWHKTKENYCNECIAELRSSSRGYSPSVWSGDGYEGYGYMGPRIPTEVEDIETLKARLKGIPRGNLQEAEYRFWIGREYELLPTAYCRACGEEANSPEAREKHKSAETEFKDDQSCILTLVSAYRRLLQKGKCAVCGLHCYNRQRWGVPICCPECVRKWKFENREWIGLAMEVLHERKLVKA